MNLKNYTSTVPAERSIMKIEKRLVEIGASHIAKSYDRQILSGIIFQVDNVTYRLPAYVDRIEEMMLKQIKRPQSDTKVRILHQASRTGWKLLLDWVEVQTTLILIGRRQVVEVFLPYVYDFQKDRTFYQQLVETKFKMLPMAKGLPDVTKD